LFLTCQHLSSGTNLRECENQNWFKVQEVLVLILIDIRRFRLPPKMFSRALGGYAYSRLRTTVLNSRHIDDGELASLKRQAHFIPRKTPGTHFC
jgi:hypothetical protein